MRKFLLFILLSIVLGSGLSACKNKSGNDEQSPKTGFKQPVSEALKLSAVKKIDWDAIKSAPVHPLVKKFNLNKLPVQSYDTAGFKPFKHPVEETKFDYNSLPQNDLDIAKLPSHPLKFTTTVLPLPKPMKVSAPELKDPILSLYEFGRAQGLSAIAVNCVFTDNNGFL